MTDTKKDTTTVDTKKPAETGKARPSLKTVHVVLTGSGRILGDRHHDSAEAAAAALTASAVPGLIVPGLIVVGQVPADPTDDD